jgi:hypothetical protein
MLILIVRAAKRESYFCEKPVGSDVKEIQESASTR